jgi:hypothetical protein
MVVRRLKKGIRVLRNEGPLDFTIKSLQYLKKQRSKQSSAIKHKQKLDITVKYQDAITADLSKPLPEWSGTDRKSLRLNWLMPPPGKGSGGHLNIYRFIKYAEEAGHECRVYMYLDGVGKDGSVNEVRALMGDSYPDVKASMYWLGNDLEMEEADAVFATSWATAYASFNSSLDAKRFYFVQDFEPYFYPIGSLHSLAENTYKFGFYGITAGGWLEKKLSRDYGMKTTGFGFGADKTLYNLKNSGKRNEIFFYARPYTERRGFEMGIMALDIFHRKNPEYIINLVGWDVSDYDIPFPYNNLKTLELHELSDLYNRCAAGLVMSLTNMSLLPLEMLACGTIPVVNDGENNRLVSDNAYIAYTSNDPVSLAEKLSEVVNRKDLSYIKEAAESVPADLWDKSGKIFVDVLEKETRK